MIHSFFSDVLGSNTNSNSTISILHRWIENVHRELEIETYTKNYSAANVTVISNDDLITDYAQFRDSHGKARGILKGTSGITSVMSSSIFIWMIMRSHDRLSTTQHRLLFGVCICDIISSLSYSTFNVHAPSDNDYFVWNARGNEASCDAQGFLVTLGVAGGLFYNASLNLYFLAVVKYKKSEEFIRAKIEPFLHGVPIAVAISLSIYLLIKDHYNDNGNGTCISTINAAPHCQGIDVGEIREGFDILCWRGIDGAESAVISGNLLVFIPVVIMIVSLGIIYRAVRTQENKLSRYGIGALSGANLQQQSVLRPSQQQEDAGVQQSTSVWVKMGTSLATFSTSMRSRSWPGAQNNKKTTMPSVASRRFNNVKSQSRAVMHKAFGYTCAWFLSYGVLLISGIVQSATSSNPLVLRYIVSIFVPIQGFFNLLIFMLPKVIMEVKRAKQRGETLSWYQAFYAALWSRGRARKKQGQSRSNLRNRGDHQYTSSLGNNVNAPTFSSRIKRKKKITARENTSHEEEKSEIQAPDDWNRRNTKAMYTTVSSTSSTYARNTTPTAGETKRSSNSSVNSNSSVIVSPPDSIIELEMKSGFEEKMSM